MKTKKKLLSSVIVFILSAVIVTFLLPSFQTESARFEALYFFMSRMEAGLDGTGDDEVEHIIAFRPTQNFSSGGTLTIYFPSGQHTEWCRDAGALEVEGVDESAADLPTDPEWEIGPALPAAGTLSATCVIGTGINDPDRVTISNVGALTAGITYGVRIASDTGTLGTGEDDGIPLVILVEMQEGADLDFGIFEFQLLEEDQVVITAFVSEIPSVTCEIGVTEVDLGTLFPGAAYQTGTTTIAAETSANAEGYYWVVYGQGDGTNSGLFNSVENNLLQSGPTDTLNLAGFGTEGFGLVASTPLVGAATAGTVATRFLDTTVGTFGTLGASGPSGAKLLIYWPTSQELGLATSTITFGGRAGAGADPGDYEETVTFVCGGYY